MEYFGDINPMLDQLDKGPSNIMLFTHDKG